MPDPFSLKDTQSSNIFTPTGMPKGMDQIDPRKQALTKALGGSTNLQTIADETTSPVVRSVGGQTYLFENRSYRLLQPSEINGAVNYASSARGTVDPSREMPLGEGFYNAKGDYVAIGRPTDPTQAAANPYTGAVATGIGQGLSARDQAAAGEVSGDYRNPYTETGGISGGIGGTSPSDIAKTVQAATTAAALGSPGGAATTAASATGAMPSYMRGFDATKWADASHTSIKYTAGRILGQFPPTDEGWAQATTAIRAAFPNAQIIGNDKIDFGDGFGPIDVRHAADAGGDGWQWEPTSGAGAAASGGTSTAPAASSSTASTLLPNLQDPNFAQQLLQMVMQALATNSALKR
jgi:hypothetical protein